MLASVNLSLSSKDKEYEDIIVKIHSRFMFASLNLSLSSKDKKYEDIIVKILPDSHWRGLEPSYVLRHQLKGGQVVLFLFLSM